jgi:hypothetical protein
MKRTFFLLFSGLFCLAVFSQNKIINDPNAEVRNVTGFHAIKVSTGIELILKQGNTEAVAVSAAETAFRDRMKTEVVNGVLKIYYDNNWWHDLGRGNKRLKAYVSFKMLDRIEGASGSQSIIDGSINGNKLDVKLSSGAGLKGDIRTNTLSVSQNSGSVSTISGKVQSLAVETNSGAVFHGYDLLIDKCDADASSGGSIQVTVNKELSAGASSGGGIHYKGDGVITKISTGSGGSVKKGS